MGRTLRAYKFAPPSFQAAAGLSAAQLVIFVVLVSLGALRSVRLSGAAGPSNAPALLGLLIFVPLFALPLLAMSSRYPRRRYREALIFQGILLVVFVASVVTDHAWSSVVLGAITVLVVWLLLRPDVRQYVAKREQGFTAVRSA